MRIVLLLFLLGQFLSVDAQVYHKVQVVEGQAWPAEVDAPFDRLPARSKKTVTRRVWDLSRNSSGMMTRFRSNASEIVVRYQVTDPNYGMNHMPSTGKSGVDLYAISSDGAELWCAAARNFGDTIVYRFRNLDPNDRYHDRGREYRLYFPLYNSVEWMEIGVENENYFEALPVRPDKAIVIYGTSIAHGACASRPGMSWAAQVGRKMDRPIINLGFSGNGLLAPAVLDLMTEIDAKVYILDCLPNLWKRRWEQNGIVDSSGLTKLVVSAVKKLRATKANIPILLVEHAGYTEEGVSRVRREDYDIANRMQKRAYVELVREGVTGLFYMTKEEIGLSMDAMVDGVHPTDLGMTQYAEAYELKLRSILHEPTGLVSTTLPIIQYREPGNYDWEKRHKEIMDMNMSDPPRQVILANSIVHYWGGKPTANYARDSESWDDIFTPAGLRNMAYGWDRIENVIWRVHHGELDGFAAERVLVMIGTNNIHMNTDDEILAGLRFLMEAIKVRQPSAELVLMGLLPRAKYVKRIFSLNMEIARLAGKLGVKYAYLGDVLTDENGALKEELFSDGLHPNEKGYLLMREGLRRLVTP